MQPQSLVFFRRQLKHEIGREAFHIAFNLLIQPFHGNAVKLRQIAIQNHLLMAQDKNP